MILRLIIKRRDKLLSRLNTVNKDEEINLLNVNIDKSLFKIGNAFVMFIKILFKERKKTKKKNK